VRADVNCERELYNELIRKHATITGNNVDEALASQEPFISAVTFGNVLKRVLLARGGACLKPLSGDHNVRCGMRA